MDARVPRELGRWADNKFTLFHDLNHANNTAQPNFSIFLHGSIQSNGHPNMDIEQVMSEHGSESIKKENRRTCNQQ